MCGFTGFTNHIDNSNAVLQEMLNRIKHRGPDAEGTYIDEDIALGHRRLSIIDVSDAGTQPLYSADGNLALLFNGEIYNYKTIRQALIEKGYQFATQTDSEVLIYGYQEYGTALLQKLRGMFSFVIWNKKEKTNIDGFYLKPNVIVLKHHKHYKREIFTLAHELGHCLLGIEEVESVDMMDISAQTSYSDVERWCNDFAYQFIMGQEAETLANIACVDSRNDYCIDLFKAISARTHISRLALYTRMYIDRKISYSSYSNVKSELAEEYRRREEQEKLKNSEKRGGRTPKPIISPLFLKTMQYAYFNGVVNETTFCSRLNVKPANFERELWR